MSECNVACERHGGLSESIARELGLIGPCGACEVERLARLNELTAQVASALTGEAEGEGR